MPATVQRWLYLYRNGDLSNRSAEFYYDSAQIKSFDVLLSLLTELYGREIRGGKVTKLYKVDRNPIPTRICTLLDVNTLEQPEIVVAGNEPFIKIPGGYGEQHNRPKSTVTIQPKKEHVQIRKRELGTTAGLSPFAQNYQSQLPPPPSQMSSSTYDSGIGLGPPRSDGGFNSSYSSRSNKANIRYNQSRRSPSRGEEHRHSHAHGDNTSYHRRDSADSRRAHSRITYRHKRTRSAEMRRADSPERYRRYDSPNSRHGHGGSRWSDPDRHRGRRSPESRDRYSRRSDTGDTHNRVSINVYKNGEAGCKVKYVVRSTKLEKIRSDLQGEFELMGRLAVLETGHIIQDADELRNNRDYVYVPITQKFKDIDYHADEWY